MLDLLKINRRQFLMLTAGVAGGCSTANEGGTVTANRQPLVNAGPVSNFATDGIYPGFCDQGFFVVRQGEQLFALSATCTHRKCKLIAEPDRSFYCKCHGSTFDPGGHVTKGPAKRDLPMLSAHTDERGQLIVSVPAR
jgi:cytochrome b6-f complex iron-sulfur subunit